MNGSTVDISKASLPITVVVGLFMLLLGYWVNAQDSKIRENENNIDNIKANMSQEKLEIRDKLGQIRTQQRVGVQVQGQILETLKEIKTELKAQRR